MTMRMHMDGRDLEAWLADHAAEVSSCIERGDVVLAARSTAARAALLVGADRSAFFIRDGEVDERPRFVLAATHQLDGAERPMLEAAVEHSSALGRWLAAASPRPTVFYSRRAKWLCVPILDAGSKDVPTVGALAAALPDVEPEHGLFERLAALAEAIASHYRRRIEEMRAAVAETLAPPLAASWTEPPPKESSTD